MNQPLNHMDLSFSLLPCVGCCPSPGYKYSSPPTHLTRPQIDSAKRLSFILKHITRVEHEIGEATLELNYKRSCFEDDATKDYPVDNARKALEEMRLLESKLQRLRERKEALEAERKALTDSVGKGSGSTDGAGEAGSSK
ncbi:hypothetical protein V6N13_108429 [Hibiscus sabdariffa]|uniref:Uncharacterized protein n=1 Tax=Hibiscus sabdariffa TaxID=183260 RepID=A0ABR2SST4_9ROSI